MRYYLIMATVIVLGAAGCSSAEPEGFELDHPMMPPEVPFTTTGAAANSGMLCGGGAWVAEQMENADGEEIPSEQWAEIFDEAVMSDGVAEAMSLKEFRCSDGSGTLLIAGQLSLDFSTVDIETFGSGKVQFGTFEITGTDEHESLSGSGETFADFDGGQMAYVGEATS